MSHPSPRLEKIFADLKRRQVLKVAAVYGGVAFVVLQAADLLVQGLGLSPTVLTALTVLALLGFPLALVLAWGFELTPEGLKRAEPTAAGELEEIQGQAGAQRWLPGILALAGTILLFAGGWWVGVRSVSGSSENPAASGNRLERDTRQAAAVALLDKRKIAVLPFGSRGEDPDNEVLAHGLHDDILMRLSGIRDLRVMSRTSVMRYEDAGRDLVQIASELQVGSILEGELQRSGELVRVRVRLVDPSSGELRWSETYERSFTPDDMLTIQTDIAERVAGALDATLSPDERALLGKASTGDPVAYDLYLQARAYRISGYDETHVRRAVELAEQAIARDSTFAAAYALAASAHISMFWERHDRSTERLTLARAAIDRALELDPDLPLAHEALGTWHYHVNLDYDRAIEEYEIAYELAPSSDYALTGMGFVRRRQGRMEEALDLFQRALELDPKFPARVLAMAETYALLRRYDEAEPYFRRYLELARDDAWSYHYMAWSYLRWRGDTVAASDVLEDARRFAVTGEWIDEVQVSLALIEGDPEEALSLLDAIQRDVLLEDQYQYKPKALAEAVAHHMKGDSLGERRAYEAAVRHLQSVTQDHPDDERVQGALGIAYAGAGRQDEALGAALRAVQLLPIEREAWRGPYRVEELAQTYMLLGDLDLAIDQIEIVLSKPGDLSIPLLRIDPKWNRLRGHTRFDALLDQEP